MVVFAVQACFDFGGYEAANGGGDPDGAAMPDGSSMPDGGVETGVLACAESCSGCCLGEACVPIPNQTSSQCGKDGMACTACSTGFKCGAGACVVDEGTCTNVNCFEGCCVGDYCVESGEQDWYACGKGGSACATCGLGSLCTTGGACDESHWSPTASLRMRMGSIEVSCGNCDYLSGPDPYVCFTVRGKTLCSANCVDSSVCNYGGASNPWIIENFIPSDFTSGESTFAIWDDDPEGDNVICSGTLWFPSPLEKTTGEYWLDASACSVNEGSLDWGWFTLEGM